MPKLIDFPPSIQFRSELGNVQWRIGDDEWNVLIDYKINKFEAVDAPFQLRIENDYLQLCEIGDKDWVDLIHISKLKDEEGEYSEECVGEGDCDAHYDGVTMTYTERSKMDGFLAAF